MRDRIHLKTARRIAVAAIVLGVAGCSSSTLDQNAGPKASEDPVAAAIEDLGVPVTGCSTSSGTTNSMSATMLTLTLVTDAAVISAPNGRLTVNGNPCTSTVSSVTAAMTTTTTKKIVVNGTSGNDKVILDLLPGTFGTTIFSKDGGIFVNFVGSNFGDDTFMVRGSSAVETFRFGSSSAGDAYVDVTGDKVADVKVTPGTGTSTLALTASMGAGADVVTGTLAMGDIASYAGTTLTIGSLNATTPLTAYGGAGKDTMTGGLGNDALYGGTEDDTFKMGIGTDGSDVYQGDLGTDTVDYSNRILPVVVDIGPATSTAFGTVDLSTLTYAASGGTLNGKILNLNYDGSNPANVTFTVAPTGPSDVVAQINAVCLAHCTARLTGANKLSISTASATTVTGQGIEVATGSDADTLLGLTQAIVSTVADADDGIASELDDVRSSTENITGGTMSDFLYGDSFVNVIKGGAGDDHIEGGVNTNSSCTSSTAGDSLQGEAGDDTFYMPQYNCHAAVVGLTGADTVDFSGRALGVNANNDGVATDGDIVTAEFANIATDVETIIGGFGGDNLTGGANADTLKGGAGDDFLSGALGDDTFFGGSGADTFNGGGGFDTVDYSAATASITATLCVTTGTTVVAIDAACTISPAMRDDGLASEGDQIANVEHVLGGTGADTMTAATGQAVDVTFEGSDGNDHLTGSDGNDTLWGDADDDVLIGGAGDDNLEGSAGSDTLDGGSGDGDVCVNDAADIITPHRSNCEL